MTLGTDGPQIPERVEVKILGQSEYGGIEDAKDNVSPPGLCEPCEGIGDRISGRVLGLGGES